MSEPILVHQYRNSFLSSLVSQKNILRLCAKFLQVGRAKAELGKIIQTLWRCILFGEPRRWIDLGAGCGFFIECANRFGIDGIGLESSRYAVSKSTKPLSRY